MMEIWGKERRHEPDKTPGADSANAVLYLPIHNLKTQSIM